MHPKFDPTGVGAHDLQIRTVYFMSLRCPHAYNKDCGPVLYNMSYFVLYLDVR